MYIYCHLIILNSFIIVINDLMCLPRRWWKTLRQTRISGKIYRVRRKSSLRRITGYWVSGRTDFRAAVTMAYNIMYYIIKYFIIHTYP